MKNLRKISDEKKTGDSSCAVRKENIKTTWGDRVALFLTAIFGVGIYQTEYSYAAVTMFDSVKKVLSDNFTPFITMACSLAVALLAVAALFWFIFPSDRGAETGKRWFVRICLCLVLLLSLGAIFSAISQFTDGMGADISGIKID